jgi:hypothetical protein
MTILTFWASMLCMMLYGYSVGFGLLQETQIACGTAACALAWWNAREVFDRVK